jgi:hypothetical protein
VLNRSGVRRLRDGHIDGADPLAGFSAAAAEHLLRSDGFAHAPDILIGSFYDSAMEEGCAFEELISFHGGIGGPQTRPFLLYPSDLPLPTQPLRGAASINRLLRAWRAALNGPEEYASGEMEIAS